MTDEMKIKECIKNMAISISDLSIGKRDRVQTSMKVNDIIDKFKLSKGITRKFSRTENNDYLPLVTIDSIYLEDSLGFSIEEVMLSAVKDLKRSNDVYNMLNNEVFNLINYFTTTVNLIDNMDFTDMVEIFSPITNKYRDMYRCISYKNYNKNNHSLLEYLGNNGNYKIMFMLPTDGEIIDIESINYTDIDIFGLPIIVGNDGLPHSTELWNIVYTLNKTFGSKIVFRCLVPFDTKVLNAKAFMENLFLEDINKYFIKNMIKIPLQYSSKTSILLLSTVDTLINKIR